MQKNMGSVKEGESEEGGLSFRGLLFRERCRTKMLYSALWNRPDCKRLWRLLTHIVFVILMLRGRKPLAALPNFSEMRKL